MSNENNKSKGAGAAGAPADLVRISSVRFREVARRLAKANDAWDAVAARDEGAKVGYDIWLDAARARFKFAYYEADREHTVLYVPESAVFSYEEMVDRGMRDRAPVPPPAAA